MFVKPSIFKHVIFPASSVLHRGVSLQFKGINAFLTSLSLDSAALSLSCASMLLRVFGFANQSSRHRISTGYE